MASLVVLLAILIAVGVCALLAIFEFMRLLACALLTLALLALIG
ncbi:MULTISPECIES: hypothetical protein [Enorma]|uniref:Phosphatidate cytidylyltransferase n=1 Tax=Enorma phocaeensis TaxID=1871019 RepID=A0ABT7VAU6_9ACTN|nr:hypothetical protein [Enorma phocaeensis]MDM8275621.1 hypothetical protein [Enorma phocaeensis]